MIICPINQDECPKKITPKAKNVFIMSPSNSSKELEKVIKGIVVILKKHGFNYTLGSSEISVGDYFCGSICQNILASPFGIAFFSLDINPFTLCNIFMEKGLMLGFGKPVVILIDKFDHLPSDCSRSFSVAYREKNYLQKFEEVVKKIKQFSEYYYKLGDLAYDAGDYEKASKFYKDAYLISGKDKKGKIKKLVTTLKENRFDCKKMAKRLLEDCEAFFKLKK